jgi:hypothetical protein
VIDLCISPALARERFAPRLTVRLAIRIEIFLAIRLVIVVIVNIAVIAGTKMITVPFL